MESSNKLLFWCTEQTYTIMQYSNVVMTVKCYDQRIPLTNDNIQNYLKQVAEYTIDYFVEIRSSNEI